jgi:hypothetical protein
MLARRGSNARHRQRDDQNQSDDMGLWFSTREAPTFIMNSFATSSGNKRVPVCGQSSTGTPFLAQTQTSALLRRNTSARRPFWFSFPFDQVCQCRFVRDGGAPPVAIRLRPHGGVLFETDRFGPSEVLARHVLGMTEDGCSTVSPKPGFALLPLSRLARGPSRGRPPLEARRGTSRQTHWKPAVADTILVLTCRAAKGRRAHQEV